MFLQPTVQYCRQYGSSRMVFCFSNKLCCLTWHTTLIACNITCNIAMCVPQLKRQGYKDAAQGKMLSSAHSYSSYYFSSYFKVHLFITHLHLHHFYNTNQTTNCNYKSYFKHLSVLLAFVSFTYQSIFQSITELHSFHFREAL